MHRDIPAELRELVSDQLREGTSLADSVLKIADALEQQASHFTAVVNGLVERIEACEAEQVLS